MTGKPEEQSIDPPHVTPWFGRLFAGAMIAFFIMVLLGVGMIYYYQKNAPKPEPLPFVEPPSRSESFN